MIAFGESGNLETLKECVSVSLIAKSSSSGTEIRPKKISTKRRKNQRKSAPGISLLDQNETEGYGDLCEFVDYLADEIFSTLPEDLRLISYAALQDNHVIADRYGVPLDSNVLSALTTTLPTTVSDSLCSYGLIDDSPDLDRFLEPILNSYITAATAAPPEYTPSLSSSRPPGCEICSREHLPLTYHHLIPRQVHEKAVRRGWHKEWELNKVAWLCRTCHSFVHKVATNEELAKEFYDVELLLEREDVQRFATWVGRVRWKAR